MKEAVIVSTARTPIGKAYRGAFNNTGGSTVIGVNFINDASSTVNVFGGTLTLQDLEANDLATYNVAAEPQTDSPCSSSISWPRPCRTIG